jgi:hypothetical protein
MNILLSFIFLSTYAFSQVLNEEKEMEVVEFSSVKDLLKKDGLAKEAEKKKADIKKIQVERQRLDSVKYNYPSEKDMWAFISEFWLVKNAVWLKWDMNKPDYGIAQSFNELLMKTGLYQKKYKILIVDNPELPHLGLPYNNGEYLLLLSLPFMRTLDLSKLEISLLLLEDLLRLDENYFKKEVTPKELASIQGSSFEGKKLDFAWVEQTHKNYNEFITKRGFNFQQQFQVTKRMDNYLKAYPDLWNSYIKLLNKIDRLVKNDKLFNVYIQLYPSPEMQIKWLSPEEKIL